MPESAPCPICQTPAAQAAGNAGYRRCPGCDHRWRDGTLPAVNYRNLAERNDASTPWFQRKLAARSEALLACIDAGGVGRILEIGCAEGALGARLRSERSIVYEGIEISRDAERAARVLDRVHVQPAGELHDVAPFDLIVSFHVLEHLADPAAEMASWHGLLAAPGQLLVEVPNGSGHPLLVDDRNAEHLHQFSLASLALLASRAGFAITAITSGHYESPGYTDSLRLHARPRAADGQASDALCQRLLARLGPDFAIFGLGGDFRNYIEPIIDRLPVRALLDSSPERWGSTIAGHRVSGDCQPLPAATRFLVCSLRFGASIRTSLMETHGIASERIVGIEEILDAA